MQRNRTRSFRWRTAEPAGLYYSARTLLSTEPNLVGDHIELRPGLKFDMQFNNDARVYKGAITKTKELRHKTVYVCDYDDGDTIDHTEEELRIALRGE